QVDDLVLEAPVVDEVVGECIELLPRRELPEEEHVGRLLVRALLGELLDGIAAVKEDPPLPVDVADAGLGGGYSRESGNVRDRFLATVHRASSSVRCGRFLGGISLAQRGPGFYHPALLGETPS